MYGKPGSNKAVPKRERTKELSDIMEEKHFLVIDEGHNEYPICDLSDLFALSSFTSVNAHYTCILKLDIDAGTVQDDSNKDGDSGDSEVEDLEDNGIEQPSSLDIN